MSNLHPVLNREDLREYLDRRNRVHPLDPMSLERAEAENAVRRPFPFPCRREER